MLESMFCKDTLFRLWLFFVIISTGCLLAEKFQYWVSLILAKILVLALIVRSLINQIECMYPALKLKTRFEHYRYKLPRTQLYFKGLHHILFWYMNSLKHEKKSECNSSQFCCLRKIWDFFQVQASSINIGQPSHYHGFPWHCKNLVNGH